MKNDNRGFTLIELLVSLVIFALVVSAAVGFMLAGARSYKSVSGNVNLHLQSELTMNQLSEYIIDCNACLYFKTGTNENTLYVINKDSVGTYAANVFTYVKSDNCIYYKKGSATLSNGVYTCTFPVSATNDLLAENVTKFDVTPIHSEASNVTSATVEVSFLMNSVSTTDTRTIALRNKPLVATAS